VPSSNNNGARLQLGRNFNIRDTFSQEPNNFIQSENIELFLVLTNHSADAVTLTFSNGQQYDFYIKSSIDIEVWRWSENKAFTLDTTELIDSEMASAGSYFVFGLFLDQPETLQFDLIIQ